MLLQNRVAITNWGKMYYKLGQILQIRAVITNWGIAITNAPSLFAFVMIILSPDFSSFIFTQVLSVGFLEISSFAKFYLFT